MTNLESLCDGLYNQWATLPGVYPREYPIWFGGHNYDSSYKVIVDKSINNDGKRKSRKESWRNLLVNYFKFPELDLSKNNKFDTKVWNTFLSSGYKVIDKQNNRKITAYTPWYSFLFRPFIGGDLIIVKVKENYSKKFEKY